MGFRINCVAPGLIDNGHLEDAQMRWMSKRVPAGRLGRVEEVAACVSFLLRPESSYVNGATLAVSGGWDWFDRDSSYDTAVKETFAEEIRR